MSIRAVFLDVLFFPLCCFSMLHIDHADEESALRTTGTVLKGGECVMGATEFRC